jgi:hypothetical protein
VHSAVHSGTVYSACLHSAVVLLEDTGTGPITEDENGLVHTVNNVESIQLNFLCIAGRPFWAIGGLGYGREKVSCGLGEREGS